MCVRPARCDQGPSLFAYGSDQLPEPADLFYHPSPKEGSGLFSLRSQANGISAPGQVRKRSEEHTSELQSLAYLVCRLLLEKKKREPRQLASCDATIGL